MTIKMNEKEALALSLDKPHADVPDSGQTGLLPGSRSRLIELIEDLGSNVGFSSSIACQSLQWEVECLLDWEQLKKTDFEDVRYCTLCEEKVYTAYSKAELERLISQGACTRVVTRFYKDVMGFAGDGYEFDDASDEGEMHLVNAILDLNKAINTFQKRRGYFPLVKLERLKGRLLRYQQQLRSGVRSSVRELFTKAGLEKYQKVAEVERLVLSLDAIERKIAEARIYLKKRSSGDI